MANLGSDDTPIAGESFGLPSGWSLTENDAGEVVIEDSGGSAVFRRNETAGEWVTDSIDAESVSVEELTFPWQFPEDVTDSRSLGTWFQNTTGKNLLVVARVENDGGGIRLRAEMGESSQTSDFEKVYFNQSSPNQHRKSFSLTVPDGSYYNISEFDGAELNTWHESEVGT